MLDIKLFIYVGSPFWSRPWVANARWNASKSCIQSMAKSCGCASVLLKTRMKGSRVLYRILADTKRFEANTIERGECTHEQA